MCFPSRFFPLILILFSCFPAASAQAQSHPRLVLTPADVLAIRAQLGKVPLYDASLADVVAEVDQEIQLGIDLPIPKDFSGGYTHERHKMNFLTMEKAGLLYQITANEKYAVYVRDMLLGYAKLYPTLPLHPQERSYARGKIFWQALNDANWLVYVSQAYDCVFEFLSASQRTTIENDLLRPFADFISTGSPQFFNRVHNHSTWGNVAVGMLALVLDDAALLERALHGLKEDGLTPGMKDSDGGLIKKEGQKTGFYANLDEPFSPDGYYTEGPYYQRYAMYPFLIFAEALAHVKPELKIFEYKNGILVKSVYALLNLTDAAGQFFPLNDAQKGMSFQSRELVSAVDIAYAYGSQDPALLSVAQAQDRVRLDKSGLAVALGIRDGLARPFVRKSVNLSDGPDGKQGGVAIIRSKPKAAEFALVFKYAAQGLSHGHYDKLSFSYYKDATEILQDYGLARFVNIEQKGGGNYLKENTSWAKQTIAHNTLVLNETSHFNGDFETGNQYASSLYFYDFSNPKIQLASAVENHAYLGTTMRRTLAVIQADGYENPLLLDVFQVQSDKENQYDLPFYYFGQLMATNFKYETPQSLEPLGTANGYQHLWKEASGMAASGATQFSWLQDGSFQTLTMATTPQDALLLVRTGANDPEFNLRRDPGIILRRKGRNTVFATVLETHGSYSPVTEAARGAYSNIASVQVVYEDANYVAVEIVSKEGASQQIMLALQDSAIGTKHQIKIHGKTVKWRGPYHYTTNTK